MFEDIEQSALTAEQENMVRKYVDPKTFDVEGMIDHLRKNETIGFDIFTSNNVGEKVGYTFLRSYKPVSRSVFIRRLPIYFFDLMRKSGVPSITELFEDFIDFKYPVDPSKQPPIVIRGDGERFTADMDLESVYVLLEKLIYEYRIPLDLTLSYIGRSFGRPLHFKQFYHWMSYLDLLDKLDETNVFPESLYYSLNMEYKRTGKPARFVLKERYLRRPYYDNERKAHIFSVAGYFPIDPDGNVVMDWTGLWLEDVGEIKVVRSDQTTLDDFESFMMHANDGSAMVTLEIPVNPDSRVFALYHDKDSSGKYRNRWKQIYSGSRVSQFTFNPIVQRREQLKLSQKEVAELADINLRSYQRIEKGESTPDALNLIELMSILEMRDIESFISKPVIMDDDYSKFRSGEKPSTFLEEGRKGGSDI